MRMLAPDNQRSEDTTTQNVFSRTAKRLVPSTHLTTQPQTDNDFLMSHMSQCPSKCTLNRQYV